MSSFFSIKKFRENKMLSKIKNQYFIFFISFLIYFPIILWGGYFLDDNYRSIYGYYAWISDYRPIADFIYSILGLSTDFVDTFPLNYIIQFFLISSFIIYFTNKIQEVFSLEEQLKNYISISLSFLFLSPLFIQNLYFRYDSLIMVISVIISCVPFFFNNKKIDFLCCIIILFTYQSSIVGYMFVVTLKILALNLGNHNRINIYKEVFKSILVFISSLLFFFLIIKLFITPNNYAKNHTTLITSLDMLIENIEFSLDVLKFSNSPLDYSLLIFSLIISILFIFRAIFNNFKIHKLDKIILSIGVIFILSICILNINIILLKPRLYPRTYIGFGFVLLLIGISLTILMSSKDYILKKYIYFYKFLVICIFIMCLNIFYAGYNYIKETERYSENLINNINYDLSTLGVKKYKYIMAYGKINYPLRAKVLENRYPILKKALYDKMDLQKHRLFYDLLHNTGYEFDETGYQISSIKNSYLVHINDKPTIERIEYNILVKNKNELFIYLKKSGVPVKVPLIGNRLD
ncbi:glucosyltransferase domain-containing protein [Acinetobacter variabilis]|uniref:glucosyltransferase domain-containing protein n=1 Tax=Acinetobacter variabilis TaxID=70346 RepID=UPI00403DFB12